MRVKPQEVPPTSSNKLEAWRWPPSGRRTCKSEPLSSGRKVRSLAHGVRCPSLDAQVDSHPAGEGCHRRPALGVTGDRDIRSVVPGLRSRGERPQEVLPAQQPALEGIPTTTSIPTTSAFRKGKNKPPNSERFLKAEREPFKRSLPLRGTHSRWKLNDGVGEPHPRCKHSVSRVAAGSLATFHLTPVAASPRWHWARTFHSGPTHAWKGVLNATHHPCFGPEFLLCFTFRP